MAFMVITLDLLVSCERSTGRGRHEAPRANFGVTPNGPGIGEVLEGVSTTTLSTSGSLPGSSIRSVTGWISATPAGSGACNVVDTQSAINGHWSQSTGADLSGQHGMSSDMSAI